MAENDQRSRGRPGNYKFDRGGMPAEMGPFIGIVVNNIDNTRAGRLQVWIAEFGSTTADGGPDLTDDTLWRTVSYCPPFYGATPQSGSAGVGTYPGNRNSYGMWFTPPDLGTRVLCFFVGGDPDAGYYVGCLPEDGINHMIPAIGSASNYELGNNAQSTYLAGAPLLPVTEINDVNPQITNNPRFFNQTKPVQSVVAGVLLQQGLDRDPIRGPIRSSSQRESPSSVYGISTPGKPIYNGGLDPKTIKDKLAAGSVTLQDIKIIGRQGGHTFVMDDGDLVGGDTLVRIRTAKGHQITMSDDGDCFYITHANGQTWLEFGKQGTVDVYSTNSINLRTQGTLNFHADQNINMYAGGSIKIKSRANTIIESDATLALSAKNNLALYSEATLGIRSDGTLGLQGKKSSWKSESTLNLKGTVINLNGAPTIPVSAVPALQSFKLPDTSFGPTGWTSTPGVLDTIVTRAPTHEPYAGHGQGVAATANLNPTPGENNPSDDIPTGPGNPARSFAQVSESKLVNPITAADFIKEPIVVASIGNMNLEQLQGLTAQSAVAALSKDAIGKYGQTPEGLTLTGFLKPATLGLIPDKSSSSSIFTVLSSPAVWTGLLGMVSLSNYLSSEPTQQKAQTDIMAGSYQGLVDEGILTGDETAEYQATFVQPATEYGVDNVVDWVHGNADEETTDKILISARQAQYAINFVDSNAAELSVTPTDVTDTVIRNEVDQAVEDVIGNPKIPTPDYVTNNVANVVPATNEDGTLRLAPGSKES